MHRMQVKQEPAVLRNRESQQMVLKVEQGLKVARESLDLVISATANQ